VYVATAVVNRRESRKPVQSAAGAVWCRADGAFRDLTGTWPAR
jgi:hypothetical protein